MNKENIRKEYKLIRKNILDKDKKSILITKRLVSQDCYKHAKTIAIYMSLNNEVNTSFIIKDALESNKIVLLPKIEGEQINFYRIFSLDEKMQKSQFNIYEPIPNSHNHLDTKIDLIVVPGVCFDTSGNRIGYGKGYYDKFLAKNNIYKIGICFDEQLLGDGKIESTNNDIKMNQIISDRQNLILKEKFR